MKNVRKAAVKVAAISDNGSLNVLDNQKIQVLAIKYPKAGPPTANRRNPSTKILYAEK